jgi:hypothetical protein
MKLSLTGTRLKNKERENEVREYTTGTGKMG